MLEFYATKAGQSLDSYNCHLGFRAKVLKIGTFHK